MKKNLKLMMLLIAAIVLSENINAQLKLNSKSQVHIGQESTDVESIPTSNVDTITRLKIFGPFGGDWRSGGRISFGDQASIYAMNVIIGELGTEDCDKLWLHGKSGYYLTSGWNASDTIAYYDPNRGNFFKFNCDVKADGVFVSSDERFKENINPLEESLASLSSISPVSYNLKPHFTNKSKRRGNYSFTEKDKKDLAFYEKFYNEIANDTLRYGFLAQDVKAVFPELVKTDKDGYMYVDYIGMIPILVNAVNELKEQLDEALSGRLNTRSTDINLASTDDITTSIIEPKLYQNSPNPFNAETRIKYTLPEEVINAEIYIYNLQGNQISKYTIAERGEGSLQINASELDAGMYIYTLIADGKEIDTKRMILTQ